MNFKNNPVKISKLNIRYFSNMISSRFCLILSVAAFTFTISLFSKSTVEAKNARINAATSSQSLDDPIILANREDIQNNPFPGSHLPRETLELIAQGMSLAERGEFNAADEIFERAAQISPNSAEVFAIRATAARMSKNFQKADQYFARAAELDPYDEEIAYNWGMSRLLGKDTDGAIRLFKKTLEINPKNIMAHNSLGKAYGRKKEYIKEEASYRKALGLNPQLAVTNFNLGIVLSLQQKFDQAVPFFKKAIKLDKEFDKPFVQRFLQQYSAVKSIKKGPKLVNPEEKKQAALGKAIDQRPEGSDHKMEGSDAKIFKEYTDISGKILINGQPIGPNAIVYLETKDKLKVPNQTIQSITISQNNLQFSPSNSAVQVGSTLTFANNDREIHNIYSKSLKNQFNLGAMASGASRSILVQDAGPIVLRCNMHKDMIGTVFVAPNGYFTTTNEKSEYLIQQVKSKEYIMQVWHPRLYPREIDKYTKLVSLNGKDEVIDFKMDSDSKPGEIHDLVDATDYDLIVDNIERLLYEAIGDWKKGKKYLPRRKILKAATFHFQGEGLKGALSKSFSEKRSAKLEKAIDDIRKKISGYSKEKVTENSLKTDTKRVVAQLRNNVLELKARIKPGGK
jgi:Tfp pilus assembly protein PilF/plastocyanin